jgi:hypothetical protein
VTVPTFSLDSGLIMERQATVFGREFLQTLEPRAFYVYTPFRDQNNLPNYDSAQMDFNFATIYPRTRYGGHDRIADNNLLTLGVGTRFLDPVTGAESAKFGIAQRLRFRPERGAARAGAGERRHRMSCSAPRWAVCPSGPPTRCCSTTTGQPVHPLHLRCALHPGGYRVLSAAYRRQQGRRAGRRRMAVAAQRPLGRSRQDLGPGLGEGEGRWYSVGRMNYSPRKAVSSTASWAWNTMAAAGSAGSCWNACRLHRHQQAHPVPAGFVASAAGRQCLQTLKQNIPRYQFLRERASTPSRFSNYDTDCKHDESSFPGLALACRASRPAGAPVAAQVLRATPQIGLRPAPRTPARNLDYIGGGQPGPSPATRCAGAWCASGNSSPPGLVLPPRSQLAREVLDRLITEKAQLQLARESGVRVDEAVVDEAEPRWHARMAST